MCKQIEGIGWKDVEAEVNYVSIIKMISST